MNIAYPIPAQWVDIDNSTYLLLDILLTEAKEDTSHYLYIWTIRFACLS